MGGLKPEAFRFFRWAFVVFGALLLPSANAVPPLTLSAALDQAKAQHPILKAARAEVEAAKARGWMLQVPYQPMVGLNAYASRGRGDMIFSSTVEPGGLAVMGADEQATFQGMAMWRVFSFGRDKVAKRVAESEVGASQAMLRTEESELKMRVRSAFSKALLKRDALAARNAATESAEEVLRITNEAFSAGKVPEAFVFRAQADASSMRRESAMAEAEAATALVALKQAIAGGQAEEAELGAWDAPLDAPTSLPEAIKAGFETRSELAGQNLAMKALHLRARQTELSMLPELSFVAMGDWMAMDRGMTDNGYRLGLVLSFPFGDGGMRRSTRAEQRAMADKTAADLETTKLAVEAEVASAWAEWQVAPKVRKASEDELRSGEEAYRIALLRYREGKAILAEVIDARAQLVRAKLAVAESDEYSRRAWTMLQRAIGR